MVLSIFVKALVIYVALALIAYALSPYSLEFLLKLLALALGAALLTPLVYPYIRGVRKGDAVMVEMAAQEVYMPGLLGLFFQTGTGVALENGRIGGRIRVALPNGSERACVITGYAGFFSPARVRIAPLENEIRVI